jgi:hypothetical protein
MEDLLTYLRATNKLLFDLIVNCFYQVAIFLDIKCRYCEKTLTRVVALNALQWKADSVPQS